jgi:hypothetical protein
VGVVINAELAKPPSAARRALGNLTSSKATGTDETGVGYDAAS